jgi:hypothetical protein
MSELELESSIERMVRALAQGRARGVDHYRAAGF